MDAEETRKSGRRWPARTLAWSAALALALAFLAWAAPALKLYYHGLRYRMGWGREKALGAIVNDLSAGVSPRVVLRLLGPPDLVQREKTSLRYVYCGFEDPWAIDACPPSTAVFRFAGGRLVSADGALLPGLVVEDTPFSDWDGCGLVDMDGDGDADSWPAPGPIQSAAPAGGFRRFLRGMWRKVTGDG